MDGRAVYAATAALALCGIDEDRRYFVLDRDGPGGRDSRFTTKKAKGTFKGSKAAKRKSRRGGNPAKK